MDTGVALITLNAGITGNKARPWNETTTVRKFLQDILQNIKNIGFPLIVGSLRFFVISDFDYQEHASEWGIHWNFYTTVAIIGVLQTLVISPKFSIAAAFSLRLLY